MKEKLQGELYSSDKTSEKSEAKSDGSEIIGDPFV